MNFSTQPGNSSSSVGKGPDPPKTWSLEGSSGEEPRYKVFYIKFSVVVCDDEIEISIYMEFSSNLILTYIFRFAHRP